MKIKRSKEWWLNKAIKEGGFTVGAGAPAFPTLTNPPAAVFDKGTTRLGSGCITGEFQPR